MTPRTLIGGVGYRWQRDASFGLAVTDALAALRWPATVEVQDLGYGALHVAQDIAAATPPWQRLVLVAAAVRDRTPGGLYARAWAPPATSPEEVQARIREAGAGVIDLDHLLVVGTYLRALPADVLLIELEPVDVGGGDGLSAAAAARLPDALERVRRAALAPAWRAAAATV